MMPVIRITDATWDRLKKWAIPLEDSPEDAVRKVLDAAEEHLRYSKDNLTKQENTVQNKINRRSSRIQPGLKTPNKTYKRPILEALNNLGGRAAADEVLRIVEKKLKPLFNEIDLQRLPYGTDVRWRNAAQWERLILVKEGLLKSDSPRGLWELSEKGIQELKKNS